jgi:hypothetical protein
MNQPSNSEICQDQLRLMGLELFDAVFCFNFFFINSVMFTIFKLEREGVLIAGDDVAVPV